MAFRERVEYITTSKTPSMKGLAFPVVLGAGGFFTRTDGLQTILNGLKQLLLTNRGERVMRPDFGTSLRRAAFQPMDSTTESALIRELMATIQRYEPRVVVKKISVRPDTRKGHEDYHRLFISAVVALRSDTLQERILEIIV